MGAGPTRAHRASALAAPNRKGPKNIANNSTAPKIDTVKPLNFPESYNWAPRIQPLPSQQTRGRVAAQAREAYRPDLLVSLASRLQHGHGDDASKASVSDLGGVEGTSSVLAVGRRNDGRRPGGGDGQTGGGSRGGHANGGVVGHGGDDGDLGEGHGLGNLVGEGAGGGDGLGSGKAGGGEGEDGETHLVVGDVWI